MKSAFAPNFPLVFFADFLDAINFLFLDAIVAFSRRDPILTTITQVAHFRQRFITQGKQ
jgi:hypothetical protein